MAENIPPSPVKEPVAAKEAAAPKVFRIRRFQIGLNVLLQLLILLAILGMVNYLAFNHYKRWDFSRDQKYALSDQTIRVVKSLDKPVKFIVFFSPDPRTPGGEIYGDVTNLLKEYQYASRKKVDVETVDPYRDLSRARELATKYKFGNENVVVIDYQGRSKLVNATDMVDYDESGEAMGQPPRLRAFKGEQAITSALLEVSEEKQNKVYVLAGKGGPDLAQAGDLTGIKTYLDRQNIKSDSLSLMSVDKVPDDARALLLIGARYDLTEREEKMLREFWEKKGRIFLALDPAAQTPRLAAFLAELGVKPQDDRILRTVNLGFATGLMRQVTGNFSETDPVTRRLKGVETLFQGDTQSLALTPNNAPAANVRTTPLITAAPNYWGETKYLGVKETGAFFDPKEDHAAPLTIAASVEKGALADKRVQVDSSRMIVVGNFSFLTDEALIQANVDFTLAGLNWMLNREELIGIAPKENKQFTLNLTDEQVRNLTVVSMFFIPGIAALFGIATWARRRR